MRPAANKFTVVFLHMKKKLFSFFSNLKKNQAEIRFLKIRYLKSESSLFCQFIINKVFSVDPSKLTVTYLSSLFEEISKVDYMFLEECSEEDISQLFYHIVQLYNNGFMKNDISKFDEYRRALIVCIAKIIDSEKLLSNYTDKDIIDLFINTDTHKSKL